MGTVVGAGRDLSVDCDCKEMPDNDDQQQGKYSKKTDTATVTKWLNQSES